MPNPYARDVSRIKTLDPYRLQELYNMHPCAEHVVKKLLVAGEREGGKDLDHDISDCIRTLKRWQEMRAEDASAISRPSWATHTLIDGVTVNKEFVAVIGLDEYAIYEGENIISVHNKNTYVSGTVERLP